MSKVSVAMRRALVTLRGRCGREGGRTHRVSYGEHDGVEPPELGLILRGEIPECHFHGSPLLVVAVHLAATVVARAFLAFLNGEACRVTPRPLARMSHHSVVARLCFGRLAAPGGGRAARRLAAHCAASHHDHHGDDRGGRRHGSATAGATGSTHPGPSSAPAGDASRRVGRALQALRLEESRGHVDVRGARSLFSEYAASELTKIGTEVLPPGSDGRERWERRVAGGFARYRALSPPQRATLVAEAQQLLLGGASHTAHHPPGSPAPNPGIPGPESFRREMTPPPTSQLHAQSPPEPTPPEPESGNLADFYSTHPAPRERGKPGGKGVVTESRSWEDALAQDVRQREEVVQVSSADAIGDEGAGASDATVRIPTAVASVLAGALGDAQLAPGSNGVRSMSLEGETQGSDKWLALRSSRLTASAFSNACGFWRGGRNELWEEKLGLAEPFAGNEATEWGSGKEDEAVAAYKNLTGADVSHMLFRVLSPDEAELWLGASPDGLIAAPGAADVDPATGVPPGVLEIKCPWNKGDPVGAKPYPRAPWYYVPQVQGLMAVFDRQWCDLFCYTVEHGSAIYRVERDPEYWAMMYRALSDFWWQHVVPGKHAIAAGEDPERFRPSETHALTDELKRRSREISNAAQMRRYTARDTRGSG